MRAFWFPGQGSQKKGMLDAFVDAPVVRRTLEEASDLLGYDLARLIAENPEGKLDRTRFTQPALLTTEVALWRLWQEQGGAMPDAVAGHSLGEYAALVAAQALSFADALRLVALRGAAMEEAVAPGVGKMAAILGLEAEEVAEICDAASGEKAKVWPANDNCPGQIVVAGHADAVQEAIARAKQKGARRVVELAVSAPSHTPLMQPAAERVAEALREVAIAPARVPVWCNADAAAHTEPEAIRRLLVQQLTSPVRWREIVQRMLADGLSLAIECGPGNVLAGLARRIERRLCVHTLGAPEHWNDALAAMGGTA